MTIMSEYELIIEDGSGSNPAANSYASVEDLIIFVDVMDMLYARALAKKIADEGEAFLYQAMRCAMDELEVYDTQYKGTRTKASQPLSWPRKDAESVELEGTLHGKDEIPRLLFYAQLHIAFKFLYPVLSEMLAPNEVDKRKLFPENQQSEKEGVSLVVTEDEPQQDFIAATSSINAKLSALLKNNGLTVVKLP